jgi:hypothetical protein
MSNKNGAVNYTSQTPMTLTEMRGVAPSVFAEVAHGSRSESYQYIPTSRVLEALMQEGYQPYTVMQSGSRDAEKRAYTKHLIRMRHETSLTRDGANYEICLLNSHDGSSSYRLFGGVFRTVCANGLVVSEGPTSEVSVPHKGDIVHRVLEGSHKILQLAGEVGDKVTQFSAVQLNSGEQLAFARAAIVARHGEDKLAQIRPETVLTARRYEDTGADLWSTLNRVQENLIRGEQRYSYRDEQGIIHRARTRATNSVEGNLQTNRALWTLAAEMSKLKSN